ncbi:hypothetical protein EDM00_10100 [Ornithobacterium rhinotracheale]|nr:hypothetical protein [Ornithobacterium rhinotracheale]
MVFPTFFRLVERYKSCPSTDLKFNKKLVFKINILAQVNKFILNGIIIFLSDYNLLLLYRFFKIKYGKAK